MKLSQDLEVETPAQLESVLAKYGFKTPSLQGWDDHRAVVAAAAIRRGVRIGVNPEEVIAVLNRDDLPRDVVEAVIDSFTDIPFKSHSLAGELWNLITDYK